MSPFTAFSPPDPALRIGSTSICRSDTLWFEDGNIILQAENTLFRIHRTFLANHSGFFGDMFMVPQAGTDRVLDGCPVIEMPDSAEDWHNLLSVVYHGLKVYSMKHRIPLTVLISMLRLGKKYQFDDHRDEAWRKLKSDLPNRLDDWEEVFDIKGDGILDEEKPGFYTFNAEIDVINIALEMDIQTILPVAYFLCLSNHDLEAIFEGLPRSDGSVSHLSPDIWRVLALGRERLINATFEHPYKWIIGKKAIPCASCTTPERCTDARMHALESGLTSLIGEVYLALYVLPKKYIRGLCKHCALVAVESHAYGRRRIWEELPFYFGLRDWEELVDFTH